MLDITPQGLPVSGANLRQADRRRMALNLAITARETPVGSLPSSPSLKGSEALRPESKDRPDAFRYRRGLNT